MQHFLYSGQNIFRTKDVNMCSFHSVYNLPSKPLRRSVVEELVTSFLLRLELIGVRCVEICQIHIVLKVFEIMVGNGGCYTNLKCIIAIAY